MASEYFSEWYGKNGQELNLNRRERYNTDPDYKKQVLERNRISREKRKKRLAAEKQKEDRARLVNPNPRPWRSVG